MFTNLKRLFAQTSLEYQLLPEPKLDFRLREYCERDFQSVIDIYNLNAPDRFPVGDFDRFVAYLKKSQKTYFVAESVHHGIVGAGGIVALAENIHVLCYGLIHPSHQNKRVGSTLVTARILAATKNDGVHFSVIFAVPKSIGYYNKFGYVQGGHWKTNAGTDFPSGVIYYHSSTLVRIRKILKNRGHLLPEIQAIQINDQMSARVELLEGRRFQMHFEPRSKSETTNKAEGT